MPEAAPGQALQGHLGKPGRLHDPFEARHRVEKRVLPVDVQPAEERIVRGVVNDLPVSEVRAPLGDDRPADGRRLPVEGQGQAISPRELEKRRDEERVPVIGKDEVGIIPLEEPDQLPEQIFRRARLEDQGLAVAADGKGVPFAQGEQVASLARKFQDG